MIKNPFFSIKMQWFKVILFAVCIGIYTGLVMLIPALKNTSFQDIGISYEWWVVFAVLIVANCKKNYEACLKCFVFFLISQPVIYLTQIVFGSLSFELAKYYYFSFWLPATFLTLPGGFIAFYCKKQNLLGALILGIGNTIEAGLGVYYLSRAINKFPYHLLSCIFCFGLLALMTFFIQQKRKYRIISISVSAVLTILLVVLNEVTGGAFI